MTVLTALWSNLESGESILFRLLRWILCILGLCLMFMFVTLNLKWESQALLGLLMVLIGIWLDRSSNSYLVTLTLMFLSMFATAHYGWWRYHMVINFFTDPAIKWGWIDAFFMLILLAAETYAFVILFLGYLQTMWPLRRAPVSLPDETEEWPEVDLLIPTYNEPLSVVRYTALSAVSIDYPPEKLHVYVLDDGHREDFKQFCHDAGIGYITRTDNKGAKAGNINHALRILKSPFVAVFDSDHVPTRSFLQVTMGWFLRDSNLGMLQTPHHFYSPDPFERNLGQFRVIPNEGELFYGVVQDGNDFWNATFFCGSCAVMRRSSLVQIGGIATETVTEDAHTSLRMQMHGWNTAYINIPQAAGLATERLSGHIKQRIRWARGMIQVLRVDNPLLAPGLGWAQRLCYFNAMLHFMYALPRLIFLTAPLIYMLLGHTNIPGYWLAILAYALPHLVLSNLTNSRIQGQHRHSFWNEIYETVLAPYIMLPTMLALINPKLGKFNVTEKGGLVNNSYFDGRIARPFVVLLIFNLLGALAAIPRYFLMPWPLSLMNDHDHPGTILMNLFWIFFNITILGVATAVAYEAQQRRNTVRITTSVPAIIRLSDGTEIPGESVDLSAGGAAVRLSEPLTANRGEAVRLMFPLRTGEAHLPATVVSRDGRVVRLQYDPLSISEQEMLAMVLYSRADNWLGWGEAREADQPLRSLWIIMRLSARGLTQTIRGVFGQKKGRGPVPAARATAAILLVFAMLGASTTARAQSSTNQLAMFQGAVGQPSNAANHGRTSPMIAAAAPATADADPMGDPAARKNKKKAAAVPAAAAQKTVAEGGWGTRPGTFHNVFTLADIGVPSTIELHVVDTYHTTYFSMPQIDAVQQATMNLNYEFSPGLIPQISHIKVILNGTLFATVIVPANVASLTGMQTISLPIPHELLVRDNALTFEFIGHYTLTCEDPANTTLWTRIDSSSSIEVNGELLHLPDDLNLLPVPFYDRAVQAHPQVPIVFLSQPSPKALQAAGIVASWFGVQADSRVLTFPVVVGSIPAGNVVVMAESTAQLPATMNVSGVSGPTISMRPNPSDQFSKVLIVSGDDSDQLVQAAQALAMQNGILQGGSVHVADYHLPTKRVADDAPRWLSTAQNSPFWNYTTVGQLQGDGTVPLAVYFRIPPDLYYGERTDIPMQLRYVYNSIPLANQSGLTASANGAKLATFPLLPGDNAREETDRLIAVPIVNLRPFSNTFLFSFFFQIAKQGNCRDTAPTNMYGAVLRSSYLDIRGLPHWAALPNLELFANAGFPFTRMADMSDTTIVMPSAPSADEMSLLFNLMGHFGAQTGYPALRVRVTAPDGLVDADRDYLVIGTVDDQPAIGRLNGSMPVAIDVNGVHVKDTDGFFASVHRAWWKMRANDREADGSLTTVSGNPDSVIEGIESPYSGGRTVVVIALRDQTSAANFSTAFLASAQSSDIGHSVSILRGSQFQSYQIGANVYHVGNIPWWLELRLWFTQRPWLIVLLIVLIAFLLASWARLWLRRRARTRLQASESI
jgi:cellulose synthase (UDP-forming)